VALKLRTTLKRNINVIQHIMRNFKEPLSKDEKQNMLA
jgi:uncharacterized protein YbgA (DUF1722 family)